MEDLSVVGLALGTGTPNFGGPAATAGGVVFIGAAMDRYLRAFGRCQRQRVVARPAAGRRHGPRR